MRENIKFIQIHPSNTSCFCLIYLLSNMDHNLVILYGKMKFCGIDVPHFLDSFLYCEYLGWFHFPAMCIV